MHRDDEKTQREMDRMKARGFKPLESFTEMPHVAIAPEDLHGRRVPITAVYDEDGWHYWIQGKHKKLLPIVGVPVEALYFGTKREDPDDFHFGFLDFVFQVASIPKAIHWGQCIVADLHNLGASLAKLRFLFLNHPPDSHFARMAATELEYIFMACRSLLDLLQETMAVFWPQVAFRAIPDKLKDLPKSFAKMTLYDNKVMTAEQIATRYKMPAEFGAAYAECGEFLEWFRAFRDNVAHRGESIKVVFVMEDGFGVKTDETPFSKMPIWSEVNLRPNGIGSLHSAACYVIGKTLMTFDRMAELLCTMIQWPPPLAPGYALYARGHFIHELSRLEEGINVTPWYRVSGPESGDSIENAPPK